MQARRGLVWLLFSALVAAQALGLMHRVVHGPQAQLALGFAAEHDPYAGNPHSPGADRAHDHGAHWSAALFAGHDDDSTCRLFDPLNHEGPPAVPALALPMGLSSFLFQWFQAEALVRWAALFDARGPPSIR
ncbi:MAG TPA: hypothetical protein VLI46_03220 [Ramlibacter sp.]|nr:hypothetical protein [Ramlibacter sp.]